MNTLNIDFRGESLRVLSVRDGRAQYAGLTDNFIISETESSRDMLLKAVTDAGGRRGRINIILPSNIVKYNSYQLPAMDLEDAKKVVTRELSKELGANNFSMGIRRVLKNIPGKQEILAEYALKSDIKHYIDFLKACGIRPAVVTTSLEGIISLFGHIRPKTNGNEAILEVGRNFIEIIVFNDSRLVNYKKIQMAPVDNEKLANQDLGPDQITKIKMYTIVDALYNFVMETGSGSEDDKISHLWISGLGSIEHGTTGCVTEGLGVDCTVMNPLDINVEHPGIYTAIAGVSMLRQSDTVINLLSDDMKHPGSKAINKAILAASLTIYSGLIIGGAFFLSLSEKEARTAHDKAVAMQKSIKHAASENGKGEEDEIRHISQTDRYLYPIFRDIANNIPERITLGQIETEILQGKMVMRISASLDSNVKDTGPAPLLRFSKALEDTGRLRLTGSPDISSAEAGSKFSMKAAFEVLR